MFCIDLIVYLPYSNLLCGGMWLLRPFRYLITFIASLFLLFVVLHGPTIADVARKTTRQPTQYVNPFIGTGGHGHTFPGASLPFGMVQLSPDTRLTGWDGCSGYHYSDSAIYGFSHTHLSGTGISDYGDILFMPALSVPSLTQTTKQYSTTFSHQDERASPGHYSVKLSNNIFVELTTTTRVGFHRYSFPAQTDSGEVILDLKHRDRVLDSYLRIVDQTHIEGSRRSTGWAKKPDRLLRGRVLKAI
jgi:putative alpha-1,2-mannosidase